MTIAYGRNEFRVDEDEDEVDVGGNFGKRGIRLKTFDFAALRIDGVDRAFVVFDQIEEYVVANSALFRRRADDGDRLRIEHNVKFSKSFLR